MLGLVYTSPGKPPTKKSKYKKNAKDGPRGGIKRISERTANKPLPKPTREYKELLAAYNQQQKEQGKLLSRTKLPSGPGVSDCCGLEDGSFGDGGSFGDCEGMSMNGEGYEADAEDDDDEGLEDLSPALLATYFERVQRGGPTSNGIEHIDSGIKKRSYSTNLKRQRERWKEFVACVTGKSAWLAVKDWGSKETVISGRLCDCTETISLPTVCLTGWRMEEFGICETGCLYQNGMLGFLAKQCYPSSPKKPQFAFSTDLPEFFHLLYMGGPSSKQGFCTAIQRFLEYRVTPHPEIDYEIPKDIYENFLNVYRAWEKVKSILDIKTDILIQSAMSLMPDQLNPAHLQSIVETVKLPPVPMNMLCPICFAQDSKAVSVCFDGNFQLTTLGTKLEGREGVPAQELEDFRIFMRDIFPPKEPEPNLEGCLNFKAATNPKAGNRENSYSGVILATCARHDIPLAAVNVRTGGEKLVYAKELLEQRILGDPSCPKQRYILYDIGCTFDKYLQARVSAEVYNTMTFSVSIFHMYGHEYKCRALYNPRKAIGAGLVDGESNERVWSKSRHLVPSIRTSSAGSRIQYLTSRFLDIGEMQLLHFATSLPRLIKTACARAQESWKTLQNLLEQTGLTAKELEEQSHKMEEHYWRNHEDDKPISIHYDDEICEVLICIEHVWKEFYKLLEVDAPPPHSNYHYELRQRIAAKLKGRITPNDLARPYKLEEKLEERLRNAKSVREEWIDENLDWTQRYIEARERYCYRELKILKSDLFKAWMNRKYEEEALHRIVKGGKAADQMLRQIKKRSAKIIQLRKRYNESIDALPETSKKPEKLDEKIPLSNLGFEHSFWELDTAFESQEKWAMDPRIRDAIDAMHLNLRANEEIHILCDEAVRYNCWLVSRVDGCQRLLSVIDPNSAIGERILSVGRKSAAALQNLERLASVNLGDEERFNSDMEKIHLINKHGPARATEWKHWLDELKIDAIERKEFDLGEAPPLLIEDFAQDLDLQIQLQESDGEREINTNGSSDSE